jgi:hypothetical protein
MSSAVATLITPAFDAPFQFVDVFPLGLKWAESHNHFKVQSWLPESIGVRVHNRSMLM